jgi:Tat protein secretion system quality control protein TatD with DNase activity
MFDLIDIGANLTHDSFEGDRDAVLARAAAKGVTRLIVTGTSVTSSVQAAALCDAYPGTLHATAGVHPHHAAEFDAHTAEALRSLLSANAASISSVTTRHATRSGAPSRRSSSSQRRSANRCSYTNETRTRSSSPC